MLKMVKSYRGCSRVNQHHDGLQGGQDLLKVSTLGRTWRLSFRASSRPYLLDLNNTYLHRVSIIIVYALYHLPVRLRQERVL